MTPAEVRVPVRHVPPWACAQRMARGDARRWAHRGATFCYVVACPGCGRPSQYTAEAWGLAEGPVVTSSAPFGAGPAAAPRTYEHPEEMTSTRAVRCPGCGGALSAAGRELVLVPALVRA